MAGRTSERTERAVKRVRAGYTPTASARAEGIDPSTVFRAIRRLREHSVVTPSRRLVIVGAGNLGRELEQWLRGDGRTEPIVFLDDTSHRDGVLCTFDEYVREPGDEVLVSISDPTARQRISSQLARMGTYVARDATVGGASIGPGCLLMPRSLVSTGAILGSAVIVNTYSSIGHDVVIGDCTTLSSHVDLCGHVQVGERCFFGSGARVLPGLTVGPDAVVGAGAVVVKNVPAHATVFGNPARQVA